MIWNKEWKLYDKGNRLYHIKNDPLEKSKITDGSGEDAKQILRKALDELKKQEDAKQMRRFHDLQK